MRILWYSNAPWVPSGYGNQTGQFCAHLSKMGHEIAVLANYGVSGAKFEVGGVKVYPNGRERRSNDFVAACAADWGAEVVISLYDAWSLSFARLPNWTLPWIAWAPIDHETVPPAVLEALKCAAGVVAFSRHGQCALLKEDIPAEYIPHGISTSLYTPVDRQGQIEARKKLEFPENAFLIGMVAANNYYPSRKCIPQAICAFAELRREIPSAVLYLHMVDDESKEGVHLHRICASLGLEIGRDVIIAEQFDYQLGFPLPAMADLYRALDVLVNPSLGEGFGIPIVEAMSSGIPVIATRGTAMTELVGGSGWLVEGDPWWTQQGAWQTLPSVRGIRKAMISAYMEQTYTPELWNLRKERARKQALTYDFGQVVAPAWDAYLNERRWEQREAAEDS